MEWNRLLMQHVFDRMPTMNELLLLESSCSQDSITRYMNINECYEYDQLRRQVD